MVHEYGATTHMKVLCLAYKDYQFFNENEMHDFVKQESRQLCDLIFIALVGILDPIRIESRAQVQCLLSAHINVRIFTGDNVETGLSAARACGLDVSDSSIIEGEQLQQLCESQRFKFRTGKCLNPSLCFNNEDEVQLYNYSGVVNREHLSQVLGELKVIAKGSAKHKEILIQSLKMYDRIVCVTGDDAENALAIQQAHIGVGLGGSETKSSIRTANVVLLNDSITGITESVSQGRTVFYAIKKMVQAYITTGFNLFVYCLLANVFNPQNWVIPLPSLMIISMLLNYLTYKTLVWTNPSMKKRVMLREPQQDSRMIFGSLDRRRVLSNLMIITLELLIGIQIGYYNHIKQTYCGVILLIHMENLSSSYMIKLVALVMGGIIVLIQLGVEDFYLDDKGEHNVEDALIFYFKCFLLLQLNLLLADLYRRCQRR